jgi:hypothetical protein
LRKIGLKKDPTSTFTEEITNVDMEALLERVNAEGTLLSIQQIFSDISMGEAVRDATR